MFLLWLHTFRDRAAHLAILPGFLLLWIVVSLCVWEGCKAATLVARFVWLSLQAIAALSLSVLFFQKLLQVSP
jgi:hypothetical protein